MLVLSRRLHERIQFPGLNISIKVVAIKSGVIRLGIEAPPDVRILREEILQGGSFCVHPTSRPQRAKTTDPRNNSWQEAITRCAGLPQVGRPGNRRRQAVALCQRRLGGQGAGPVDPAEVNALGFLLGDKRAGPFKLEVEWLKVVRGGEGK
jgi:carbon storage regulator CsrA